MLKYSIRKCNSSRVPSRPPAIPRCVYSQRFRNETQILTYFMQLKSTFRHIQCDDCHFAINSITKPENCLFYASNDETNFPRVCNPLQMCTNWREIGHSPVWTGFEPGPVNFNVNALRLRELYRANYVHQPSVAIYMHGGDYSHLSKNYSRSTLFLKTRLIFSTWYLKRMSNLI
jgi:hypothetical protein